MDPKVPPQYILGIYWGAGILDSNPCARIACACFEWIPPRVTSSPPVTLSTSPPARARAGGARKSNPEMGGDDVVGGIPPNIVPPAALPNITYWVGGQCWGGRYAPQPRPSPLRPILYIGAARGCRDVGGDPPNIYIYILGGSPPASSPPGYSFPPAQVPGAGVKSNPGGDDWGRSTPPRCANISATKYIYIF